MVKKSLGPVAKKAYVKPEVTRNEPLVDITFATGTPTGTLTVTGGSPASVIVSSPKVGTLDDLDMGTGGFGDDSGSIVGGGSIIPGTGGAPGTVL